MLSEQNFDAGINLEPPRGCNSATLHLSALVSRRETCESHMRVPSYGENRARVFASERGVYTTSMLKSPSGSL